jgi:vanillate O-demethylase ferredoxin subunit
VGREQTPDEFTLSAELLTARVESVRPLCDGVVSITLVPGDGGQWPAAEPGAHIDIHLGNGLVRQYSICEPGRRDRYVIAVQREARGRGGSAFVHDNLCEGDVVPISAPRNNFPFIGARRYLFIAGGIGITPIIGMAFAAHRAGAEMRLFYMTRDEDKTAFRDTLAACAFAGHVTTVHDGGDASRSLDLKAAIGAFVEGTHLYCCGPSGLMRAIEDTARALGWPQATLHFESFAPATPVEGDTAFTVRIGSTGQTLSVGSGETLLGVLRDAGFVIDSSCEQGICGTCRVGVLAGEPDHRDQTLSDVERASNTVLCACVSRARSAELTLDL